MAKKVKSIRDHVPHLLGGGAAVISLISLGFSVAGLHPTKLDLSVNAFLQIVGTITTGLAFLVGGYFALLAVSAYSSLRGIDKQVEKVQRLVRRANREVTSILRSFSNHFLTSIEDHIALESAIGGSMGENDEKLNRHLKKRKQELLLMRARMSYKFPYLDQKSREGLLGQLLVFGTEDDVAFLNELADSPHEPHAIRSTAQRVLRELKGRLAEPAAEQATAPPENVKVTRRKPKARPPRTRTARRSRMPRK